MTQSPTNWPNPERPGYPIFPERDGWHILQTYSSPGLFYWDSENQYWFDRNKRYYRTVSEILVNAVETKYISICLTPAQINEMLAAERERCAKECERLKPSMDEIIGNSFFGVRGVALVDAAAAIRNLGAAP